MQSLRAVNQAVTQHKVTSLFFSHGEWVLRVPTRYRLTTFSQQFHVARETMPSVSGFPLGYCDRSTLYIHTYHHSSLRERDL
jgi:hypothetical protein